MPIPGRLIITLRANLPQPETLPGNMLGSSITIYADIRDERGAWIDAQEPVMLFRRPRLANGIRLSGEDIQRLDTGRYAVRLLPDIEGSWSARFETRGPLAAAGELRFTVPASAVVAPAPARPVLSDEDGVPLLMEDGGPITVARASTRPEAPAVQRDGTLLMVQGGQFLRLSYGTLEDQVGEVSKETAEARAETVVRDIAPGVARDAARDEVAPAVAQASASAETAAFKASQADNALRAAQAAAAASAANAAGSAITVLTLADLLQLTSIPGTSPPLALRDLLLATVVENGANYRRLGDRWVLESVGLPRLDRRTAPIAGLTEEDPDPDQVEHVTLFRDAERRRILEWNYALVGLLTHRLGLSSLKMMPAPHQSDILDDHGSLPVLQDDRGASIMRADAAGRLVLTLAPESVVPLLSQALLQPDSDATVRTLRLMGLGVSEDMADDMGRYPMLRSANGQTLLSCDADGRLIYTPSPALLRQPELPMEVRSLSLAEMGVTADVLDDTGRAPLVRSANGQHLLSVRQDGSIEARLGPDTMGLIAGAVGSGPPPLPIPSAADQPRGYNVRLDGALAKFAGFDERGLSRPFIFRPVTTPAVALEYTASSVIKAHLRDGQSNSRGAGGREVPPEERVITGTPPRPNRFLQIGHTLCGPDRGPLSPATMVDFFPASERDIAGYDRGETGIVAGERWLDEMLGDARPRHLRLLRCVGSGGATISELSENPPPPNPGEEQYMSYANTAITLQSAVAVAALYGMTIEVEDWAFNQGEAEPADAPDVYRDKLRTHIDARAALYMGITRQAYRPRVFVEVLGALTRAHSTPTTGLGQLDMCVERPTEVFASSPLYCLKGNYGFGPDGTHRRPLGHAVQCEYTAQARWRVARGELMTCIRPVAPLQIEGNAMVQLVSKPDGLPLTFDTDYFPDAATYGGGPYGFLLKGDTATVTGVTIEDVSATTARLVVTLSGAPTAAVPTLRYAMYGNTLFADRSPAYGNVRNTNPNLSRVIPGLRLHDWMMPFESWPTKAW